MPSKRHDEIKKLIPLHIRLLVGEFLSNILEVGFLEGSEKMGREMG